MLQTARAAFADALQITAAVCAVICGLTAILVVVLLRRLQPAPAAITGERQVPGELAS